MWNLIIAFDLWICFVELCLYQSIVFGFAIGLRTYHKFLNQYAYNVKWLRFCSISPFYCVHMVLGFHHTFNLVLSDSCGTLLFFWMIDSCFLLCFGKDINNKATNFANYLFTLTIAFSIIYFSYMIFFEKCWIMVPAHL